MRLDLKKLDSMIFAHSRNLAPADWCKS